MLCDHCRKLPATIRSTEIVNGKVKKKALCESCFQTMGLGLPFSAADILQEVAENVAKASAPELAVSILSKMLNDATPSATGKKCPDCGVTSADLQKRGLVGCAKDYEIFADELSPLIERLHGKKKHVGKVPAGRAQQIIVEQRLTELRARLAGAIKAEHYEDAARFRDEIRELEAKERSC